MGEGLLTELLRIVYEIFFSNAPKTLYFARDFLMPGIAANTAVVSRPETVYQDTYFSILIKCVKIVDNYCAITLE